MGGNLEHVAGYGQLSLGQAVHIAQNSDGGVDQRLAQFLERRLADVWAKLNAQPTSYILPADEFALLNYYRPRFGDNVIVKDATKRFWDNHKADCKTFDYRAIPLTTALPVFFSGQPRLKWNPGSSSCVMCDSERSCIQLLGQRDKELAKELGRQNSPQHSTYSGRLLQVLTICLMLISVPHVASALLITPPQLLLQSPASSTPANNECTLLECLQVAHPIAISSAACQQTLMTHTFAFSYGQPFVGEYLPPDCKYNRVIFNFTVTSQGRQFDRLALMFLDDIEIFRTSTAEPTQNGIVWSYVKDMSSYLAVFKQPRKMIFDLGNLVDDTYTGAWNTILTATFFTAENLLDSADIIVPVSARRSPANAPSHFTVPESRAVSALTIPQNARKAVFSISACGQADEEFWWSNVLTSDTDVFGTDNRLSGHSPFREVQLIIDGQLAGVAWPFPVIFTGGVVPGFWRPIVGIDAFDLLEDEIDITPFLPSLTDDIEHTFEIQIVGIEDDGNGHGILRPSIESSWIVTGKLFVWLDTNTSIITGLNPTIKSSVPSISVFSKTTRAANDTTISLDYTVQVSRFIHISSTLQTSRGLENVTWTQSLAYSFYGTLTHKGNNQELRQNTSGLHASQSSGYRKVFAYPLWVVSSYKAPPGGLIIDATMRRIKDVEQIGELALHNDWKAVAPEASFRGSKVTNAQNGTASYINVPSARRSYGSGSTEQHYLLSGILENNTAMQHDQVLYQRDILAVNGSIKVDTGVLEGQNFRSTSHNGTQQCMHGNTHDDFAIEGTRALLNRGPL
ncbi:peptide-n4-(n-acetyl-beta-glucosaminyl)asparagine amidase a [Stagonosporopsis vannaccii]|nr:peptide-n4-(n-acetyl-beta-glucosaminyl)asparagine amidase a [Stagonosporopsis vannaccii]